MFDGGLVSDFNLDAFTAIFIHRWGERRLHGGVPVRQRCCSCSHQAPRENTVACAVDTPTQVSSVQWEGLTLFNIEEQVPTGRVK